MFRPAGTTRDLTRHRKKGAARMRSCSEFLDLSDLTSHLGSIPRNIVSEIQSGFAFGISPFMKSVRNPNVQG